MATLQAGPQVSLTWIDNTANETGFSVERSTDGVNFAPIATVAPRAGTGNVRWVDTTVAAGTTYTYRVAATSAAGPSAYSNNATVTVPPVPASADQPHGSQRPEQRQSAQRDPQLDGKSD